MKNLPIRKSKPTGEKWDHYRNDYCKRRLSMINRAKNYDLYDEEGLPTIMHLNMLMWDDVLVYEKLIFLDNLYRNYQKKNEY
jgi:hypothetical protein